nr:hypothetical protein [Ktedonobacterales bacterium]
RLTPITSLRVGDQVRAFDAVTGTASAQTVQATWVHQDTDLLEVTLRTSPTAPPTTGADPTTGARQPQQQAAVARHGSQAPPSPLATTTTRAGTAASTALKTTSPPSTTPTRDETIRTTANHPWLTADRGWAQAGSLTLGERVVRADGSTAVVVAVRDVAGTAPMWDLTVSRLHDFAVGTGQYVVHNCGGGRAAPSSPPQTPQGTTPDFVVTPKGDVIAVPDGTQYTDVVNNQGNTTGYGYVGGSGGKGMSAATDGVRIMDPTPPRGGSPGYPDGYVRYQNAGRQAINPYTGQTIANNDPVWGHMRLS